MKNKLKRLGYSDENKVIFTHIPKTAGSSIRSVIKTQQSHISLLDIKKKLSKKRFNEYFKFTVIRNPWSRFYSYYNYRRARGDKLENEKNFNNWVLKCFNEYKYSKVNNCALDGRVVTLCDPNPLTPFRLWQPQSLWVMVNGKIAIDYVIRFEELEKGWRVCSDKIFGKYIQLPKLKMRTKRKEEYLNAYNNNSIKMVEEMFSLDIKLFKYKFGESK